MNDQKIYQLIASNPGINAVRIADRLNVELAPVSSALRSLVEVGNLVRNKGIGPNGLECMLYDLSDDFKKTREYKALLDALPVPDPEPVFVAHTTAPDPVPAPFTPPAGSKVSRAIAYLRERGQASDGELRTAMDLPNKAAPGAYLASALKSGKVCRDGLLWKLGSGKVASQEPKVAPAAEVDNVVVVGNVVLATRDAKAVPASVVSAVVDAQQNQSAYRCALWSDGTLELQCGGEQIAKLTEEEFSFMMDYMAKRAAA